MQVTPGQTPAILVEIGAGELVDKITILKIKSERMADLDKLGNVRRELEVLQQARASALPRSGEIEELEAALGRVNANLWDIEDDIRACEARGDFGPEFVRLARAVYRNNDRRAELKRAINLAAGSRLVEEKSYRTRP